MRGRMMRDSDLAALTSQNEPIVRWFDKIGCAAVDQNVSNEYTLLYTPCSKVLSQTTLLCTPYSKVLPQGSLLDRYLQASATSVLIGPRSSYPAVT